MSSKKAPQYDPLWAEAKARCRLNQEDIGKAKALGISPKTLIKNIPNPQQRWKLPVRDWVRELYEKKFPQKKSTAASAPPLRGAPGRKRVEEEVHEIPF